YVVVDPVVDSSQHPFPTRRSSDLVPIEPPSVLINPQEAVPEDTHSGVAAPVESEVQALRRLPFALTAMVLDLLPLGLFFGIAALVLQLLPGLDIRTHLVTREFVYAYVITRVVMAVVRLLLAPGDASLRI